MRYLIFIIHILISYCANATFRIDLEDRSSNEVLKKAIKFGNLPIGKTTGLITIENIEGKIEAGSGVLLDPYTVITSAHFKSFKCAKQINFILEQHPFKTEKRKKLQSSISTPPIIHESFSITEDPKELYLTIDHQNNDTAYINQTPIEQYEQISFEEYTINHSGSFTGTDLSILKLDIPIFLPQEIPYPLLPHPDLEIKNNAHAMCFGFGTLKYNHQDVGPKPINLRDENPLVRDHIRHLLSCYIKEPLWDQNNNPEAFLYSEFTSFLINGDESFIPTNGMLKTHGILTKGSSGGPLYTKVQDNYYMCGIFSKIAAPIQYIIEDLELRKTLRDYKMNIFPVWVDLRPHTDWITKHMGQLLKLN